MQDNIETELFKAYRSVRSLIYKFRVLLFVKKMIGCKISISAAAVIYKTGKRTETLKKFQHGRSFTIPIKLFLPFI
jgi:hypothetical protein